MKWNQIKRFCFTWAIPGGAWLEDTSGYVNWCPYAEIERNLGRLWWDAQIRKTGWMTGCWIDVVPAQPSETARGVVEFPNGTIRANI